MKLNSSVILLISVLVLAHINGKLYEEVETH